MFSELLQRLRPTPRIVILSVLSTLTMWLGQGCGGVERNSRLIVGGGGIPALEPPNAADRLTEAAGPSLMAGSRDHWATSALEAPVDGTVHHPTYSRLRPVYTRGDRAMGRHPTAESSATLGAEAGPLAWEVIAAPFHAGLDVVLLIPRSIEAPPWREASSPRETIERHR